MYGGSLDSYWNFDTNAVEELIASMHADYRLPQANHFEFAASLKTKYVANLPQDMQLLGGAETGMRGYPSRYQAGDRSYRVSFEERYLPDIYIARLVHVGFVVFVDAGRTWFSDDPNDDGYGTLADVGFGLRFESTRTQRDRVVHLDFAFPLVDGTRRRRRGDTRADQRSAVTRLPLRAEHQFGQRAQFCGAASRNQK
jgi:hemolysin activation/secretion protein